jgi:thiamine-phosphate pyrophosphorylase
LLTFFRPSKESQSPVGESPDDFVYFYSCKIKLGILMTLRVDFNLYLITDRLNLPAGKNLFTQVEAALRGGVRTVQLREKDLSAQALLPLAQKMRELTRQYDAKLLINREIDVAITVGADGVHLGGDSLSVREARKRLGPDRLIGVSTHAIEEIHRAERDGADFVTFGPVYATPSKLKYGQPVGLERLSAAVERGETSLPVFALGGVSAKRIPDLIACGCRHVACIGAILFAEDVEMQTEAILGQLPR